MGLLAKILLPLLLICIVHGNIVIQVEQIVDNNNCCGGCCPCDSCEPPPIKTTLSPTTTTTLPTTTVPTTTLPTTTLPTTTLPTTTVPTTTLPTTTLPTTTVPTTTLPTTTLPTTTVPTTTLPTTTLPTTTLPTTTLPTTTLPTTTLPTTTLPTTTLPTTTILTTTRPPCECCFGEVIEVGGKEFIFFEIFMNFTEAYDYCKLYGWYLATPDEDFEQFNNDMPSGEEFWVDARPDLEYGKENPNAPLIWYWQTDPKELVTIYQWKVGTFNQTTYNDGRFCASIYQDDALEAFSCARISYFACESIQISNVVCSKDDVAKKTKSHGGINEEYQINYRNMSA